MAFGDLVQAVHQEFGTQYQQDLTVSAPTAGNLLVILVMGQQSNFSMNGGAFEAGFTERLHVTNPDVGSYPTNLVLYDKISDGTEGTTIHAEWTDYNSGVIIFAEFAAAGATITHDVSAAVKNTNTGSTMASGNVDPTDGQQSIALGLFIRLVFAGTGSSFSAGTINGSSVGVTEADDYGPTYWAASIQKQAIASVASGNYSAGVTVANNISGNDSGVAGIAIYKGGAGGGGGTDHPLTASAGSYVFTGTAATISKNKPLAAGAGAYAFTGTAAVVKHAWKPTAGAGSYAFTGTAATVKHGYAVVAGAGSYAFTGTAASVLHGYKIAAAAGSYVFTGSAATLRRNVPIVAGAGSYAFTGTAATLRHAWKLSAAAGSYAFTGSDVTLTAASNKFISAAAGSYVFTGSAAAVNHGYKVAAAAGSYAFTGTAATLRRNVPVVAAAGSYAFTGTAASLLHGWKLVAAAGSYAFTGTVASVLHGYKNTAGVGSYAFTGTAASLLHNWRFVAAAGSYVFTGSDVTISHNIANSLPAGAGSYSFTGSAVAINHGYKIAAGAGAYAFTGTAATLRRAVPLVAGAGAYAFTGTAASIVHASKLPAAAGSYAFTGSAANLIKNKPLAAGAGSYLFNGSSVTLLLSKAVAAQAGAYLFDGKSIVIIAVELPPQPEVSPTNVGVSRPIYPPTFKPPRKVEIACEIESGQGRQTVLAVASTLVRSAVFTRQTNSLGESVGSVELEVENISTKQVNGSRSTSRVAVATYSRSTQSAVALLKADVKTVARIKSGGESLQTPEYGHDENESYEPLDHEL